MLNLCIINIFTTLKTIKMKNILKITFAIILFVGITNVAFATSITTLKGKVVNKETSKPVPYANISIYDKCSEELIKGDLSNSKGEFELGAIEGDHFYVVVSHLGYESEKIDYNEFVSNQKDFTIEVDAKEIILEEIIILGESIDDVASSLESVNSNEEEN